jgi:hypothetical protein
MKLISFILICWRYSSMKFKSSLFTALSLLAVVGQSCGSKSSGGGAAAPANPSTPVQVPGTCQPTNNTTTESVDPAIDLKGTKTLAVADISDTSASSLSAFSVDCPAGQGTTTALNLEGNSRKALIGIAEDGSVVKLPIVGLADLDDPNGIPEISEIYPLAENKFLIEFDKVALLKKASKEASKDTATNLFIMDGSGKLKGVVKPGEIFRTRQLSLKTPGIAYLSATVDSEQKGSQRLFRLDLSNENWTQVSSDVENVWNFSVNSEGQVLYSGSINESLTFTRRVKQTGFESIPYLLPISFGKYFIQNKYNPAYFAEIVNDTMLMGVGGCAGEIVLNSWCWLSSSSQGGSPTLSHSFLDLSNDFKNYSTNPFGNTNYSTVAWRPFDSQGHFLSDGRIQKWTLESGKLKPIPVTSLRFPPISGVQTPNYQFSIYGEAHGFGNQPVVVVSTNGQASNSWFAPVNITTGVIDWANRIKLPSTNGSPFTGELRKFGSDIIVVNSFGTGLAYESSPMAPLPQRLSGGSTDTAATLVSWSADQSVFKLINWNSTTLMAEYSGSTTTPKENRRTFYSGLLCPAGKVLDSNVPVAHSPIDVHSQTGAERTAYAVCTDSMPTGPTTKEVVRFKYSLASADLAEPTITANSIVPVNSDSSPSMSVNFPLEIGTDMVFLGGLAMGNPTNYKVVSAAGTPSEQYNVTSDIAVQGTASISALVGLETKIHSGWGAQTLFASGTRSGQSESYRVDVQASSATKLSDLDGIEVFSASVVGQNELIVNGLDGNTGEIINIRFDADGTKLSRKSAGGGVQKVYNVIEVK